MKRHWSISLITVFILGTALARAGAQNWPEAGRAGLESATALDELRLANGAREIPEAPAVTAPRAARDWSLLVYAAVDADDLEAHAGAALRELLETRLSQNVEVLMEEDAYGRKQMQRTIRRGREPAIKTLIPEQDSASPQALEQFLSWANSNTQSRHRMLLIITHSWGWKGIIQDFSLPAGAGNTMMSLPEFSRILRRWSSDILFLDSCILGNAEVLEELQGAASYIVASQRETPYSGFPYAQLLRMLGSGQSLPRDIASRIPEAYVAAYARGGARAAMEGSYDVVTSVAVDMEKWRGFAPGFKELTTALKAAGLRDKLAAAPDWPSAIADEDSNVDLYELLTRLHAQFPSQIVSSRINSLLTAIGYPDAEAGKSAQVVSLDPERTKSFRVMIEADEHYDSAEALEILKQQWESANPDLASGALHFEFQDKAAQSGDQARWLIVRGEVTKPMALRVWLPGTQRVKLALLDRNGSWHRTTLTRRQDYISASQFPRSSFLVGEAHSQGAPFIHGIGVNMKPLMDNTEERANDPLTGLLGPALYRSTRWNQATGWGDLILLNK